jgi:hypothetical protein
MKNMKWLLPILLVAALLSFGGGVQKSVQAAPPVAETHYVDLRGTTAPPVLKNAISAVETKVWTATPIAPFKSYGNPVVAARVDFSDAGATCAISCGLYFRNEESGVYTFLGLAALDITATASDHQVSAGGRYSATTTPTFDTRGANYVDLRVITISAGSVTVRPWFYGSNSRGFQ